MDWSKLEFYPDFFVDVAIYVIVAVVLIIVSKWLWEDREEIRLRKELKAWQTMKEDEDS